VDDAVFELDGELLVPTELARGPWDPGFLHGGPVAAALLRAVQREAASAELPGRLVRFHLELPRPVPCRPMRATASVARAGHRSQELDASLFVDGVDGLDGEIDGEPVCRATALLVASPPELVDDRPYPDDRLPPVDGVPPDETEPAWRNYVEACEFRTVHGAFRTPGPCTCWMRLVVPMFAGEPTTPEVSVVSLADYGNGISQVLAFDEAVFVNPEITVYLHRPPVSEWIGLEAVTWMDSGGTALSDTALYDERGRIGRGLQALVVTLR
jgi:Acyl-CoA thioesterase C-terminal domain/Acyl-CoA thioesterase N-terminal domain